MNKFIQLESDHPIAAEIQELLNRKTDLGYNLSMYRMEAGGFYIDFGNSFLSVTSEHEAFLRIRELFNQYFEGLQPVDIVC